MTTPDASDRLTALRRNLGPTGIWSTPPETFGADARDLATAVEKYGFGSLWLGGSHLAPDAFTQLVALLAAPVSRASGAASRPTCGRAPTRCPRASPAGSSSAWASATLPRWNASAGPTTVSIQNRYNVTDRDSETIVDLCEQEELAFLPWAPIQQADDVEVVTDAAREYGFTPRQIVLAWLLARSPQILPIPGSGSPEHVEDNIAAATVKLDQGVVAAITDAF